MAKADMIEVTGVVTEALPNAMFHVDIGNAEKGSHVILCHLSGKLKTHYIRVLTGDHVTVEMSPYDLTRGRIIWRTK